MTGKPGKFTYAQMEGPECNQASGIIEFYSPAYMEILRKCEAMGKVERVPLDGTPLETLLERYGFTQVDWISVDCEGCEPSFISGFDFVGHAGGVKWRFIVLGRHSTSPPSPKINSGAGAMGWERLRNGVEISLWVARGSIKDTTSAIAKLLVPAITRIVPGLILSPDFEMETLRNSDV